MKQLIISVLFLLSISVSAQETHNSDTSAQMVVVEDMPVFKKGNPKKWITSQMNKDVLKLGVKGTVLVQFFIEKNGSVSEVKIKKGLNKTLDAEVVRVVSSMPKWKPAKQRGKKVRFSYILPIKF